jgi:quinol-cytochrome oxidoreductase complex cytochrome b subunit
MEKILTTSESQQTLVFDYRTLRLLVGLVAFTLPVLVKLLSSTPISSVSASYYTEARDVFVGSLFVIGALMWAYNGHTHREKWVSKIASIAAIIVAIFPTTCNLCEIDLKSVIHYIAAIVLFSTIAYFCLGPFRKNTKGHKGKKGRRATIYLVCGWIIIGCMLGTGIAKLTLPVELQKSLAITFVAEFVALWAFGVAWIVAGKVIPPLVDKDERFILF